MKSPFFPLCKRGKKGIRNETDEINEKNEIDAFVNVLLVNPPFGGKSELPPLGLLSLAAVVYGLLLAFVGVGLAFHSWLSLLVLLLPVSIALVRRIVVEEEALRAAFGAEYDAYAARTSRLIPWMY